MSVDRSNYYIVFIAAEPCKAISHVTYSSYQAARDGLDVANDEYPESWLQQAFDEEATPDDNFIPIWEVITDAHYGARVETFYDEALAQQQALRQLKQCRRVRVRESRVMKSLIAFGQSLGEVATQHA